MSGETSKIAEVANKISEDIFKWFRWEKNQRMDENFSCHKGEEHKNGAKHDCKTHPVDVVFSYFDPYLNKTILLNTDLKSYKASSITPTNLRKAIKSLANTIDCAKSASEWKAKYMNPNDNVDIRGMLFVFNNDNEYDKNFFSYFNDIKVDNLIQKKDTLIHILEPKRIRYMFNVIKDMEALNARKILPLNNYTYYYPELHLHKTNGDVTKYPATIELLTSPYMIISHGTFIEYDRTSKTEVVIGDSGYVIYYNRDGSTKEEFMYLFDTLSRFQMLGKNIKIRVAHDEPHNLIMTNYNNAISVYLSAWGSDSFKEEQLRSIKIELLTAVVPNYRPEDIGMEIR